MSAKGNVKVVCRVRPQNEIETRHGGHVCVSCDQNDIEVTDDTLYKFTFDRVFGPESTQAECFEYIAQPIVADVLEGYNATIFAYGQTSSGKTYTMEGPSITDPVGRGIIPRTVCALFDGVLQADHSTEFTVKVCYIEIYMERIRDLLDQFRTKVNLSVREDPRQGIYVAGVTEQYCTCEEELLELMQNGATNRATAATGMNEGSSRSHSVFMVTVTQRFLETGSSKSGKLFLVDLAGSEMVRKTHASGQQLEEAKTINKSLSALGQVINALTDKNASHVPYRDSKLTRVLQESLGGNAKTALVINCSPSSYNASETLSTCRFGSRAKSIQNKPRVNEQRSVEELAALLQKAENAIDMQQTYILALEGQLQGLPDGELGDGGGGGGSGSADGSEIAALRQKVAVLSQELAEEREESVRRGQEAEKLTALLKDKEQLLVQAGDLMQEAERHCGTHREKSEQLELEKTQAIDELDNVREQLRELKDKADFDGKNLDLHVQKLQEENARLRTEIEENRQLAAQGGLDISTTGTAAPFTSSVSPQAEHSADAATGQVATAADFRIPEAQVAQLAAQLGLSAQAVQFLTKREEEWQQELERSAAAAPAGDSRSKQELMQHLNAIEAQRTKIAADLERTVERNLELELRLEEAGSGDPEAATAVFTKRERNHMRALQQRLEQLVAVHRQLLRKYAALELDNSEGKKKIALRDERIKQLEANTRSLAINLRSQAEKHVAELSKLREQVSLKREEDLHRASRMEAPQDFGGSHGVRAVRGGGDGQGVRAIRGGGARPPTIRPGGGGASAEAV